MGTGVNQLPDMASFGSDFNSAGWQRLPSGLILQWSGAIPFALATSPNMAKSTWTFPIAFPNQCLGVFPVMYGVTTYNPSASPVTAAKYPTKTSVEIGCGYSASSSTVSAFAIGY